MSSLIDLNVSYHGLKDVKLIDNKYYEYKFNVDFETLKNFEKYLNWVKGNFSLFQKEEVSNYLKVYFPNGWFCINKIEVNSLKKCFEIRIYCKSISKVKELVKILNNLYIHVNFIN